VRRRRRGQARHPVVDVHHILRLPCDL
jgi:hypothetical protein